MNPIHEITLDQLALAYSALEHDSPQSPRLMAEALAALPEEFCAINIYSRTGGYSAGYLARSAIDILTGTGHFAHPQGLTRQEAALNLWGQVFDLALRVNEQAREAEEVAA